MRRKIGVALAFVGAFLVVLAVLAQAYAPGALKKTPIDVNTTTRLEGTASLPDSTGAVQQIPVKAFSITHTDSAKSTGDVVVFQNFSCLVKDIGDPTTCVSADDPQDRLINASTDTFATDRVSAEAVNDPKYLPADAVPHEGLVNKWPFDSQKRTYKYWDSTLGKTVDATYDHTEKVNGLECYVYVAQVNDAPTEITAGVQGTYTSTTQFFIEPLTGAIINQVQHQVRNDSDGKVFLDLTLGFTKSQLKEMTDDVGKQASQLNLLTKTVPVVGYAVGIPMLLVGLGLLLLGRDKGEGPAAPARQPVAAGSK
ncbi:MAG: DUF3068 domain-containing protein [Nocardioides sp.]